tara:strand:+ start:125 stop:1054 length:930 start_codon:yes stop_codon:yes gene_type:complete
MPKISVIVNCYNSSKYLQEALDCVLNQSYTDWELIFWDNQSTDSSAKVFLKNKDLRFKYFYAPTHTGLYKARNCAMEKASGEFIAFLDADDLWHLDKLERQLSLFIDESVGLVYGKYTVLNELSNKQYWPHPMFNENLPTGWALEKLIDYYCVGLLTIMLRRKAFDGLEKKFDNRLNVIGDFDIVLRISVDWKVDCIQDSVAKYRVHGNNFSGRNRPMYIEENITWHSEMRFHRDFSENKNIKKKYYFYLFQEAVQNKLDGSKLVRVLSTFLTLPLSIIKLKLLIIIICPNFLYYLYLKVYGYFNVNNT